MLSHKSEKVKELCWNVTHFPHGISAERSCNAHLHRNVFWLVKAEVSDGEHWPYYLCVCSLALGWGPGAAGYSAVAGSCRPRVVSPLAQAIPMLQSSPLLEKCPFIFVLLHFDLFCFFLFFRYESPNIALRCGIMLRECIRHEPLAKIILFSEQFRDFFKYVEMSTFDIASDAFATFKVNCSIPAS